MNLLYIKFKKLYNITKSTLNLKNHKASYTSAYFCVGFPLLLFLALLIWGICTKRGLLGLFFNSCMLISVILMLFNFIKLLSISKK